VFILERKLGAVQYLHCSLSFTFAVNGFLDVRVGGRRRCLSLSYSFFFFFSFLCAQAVSVETMSLYWTDEEAAIIAKATYSINT